MLAQMMLQDLPPRETLYKRLLLKRNIVNEITDLEIILSIPTFRMENRKTFLTLWLFTKHLVDLNIDILDNRHIQGKHLSKRGPHLTEFGETILAKNLVSKLHKF